MLRYFVFNVFPVQMMMLRNSVLVA